MNLKTDKTMDTQHIDSAIKAAKKLGFKKVQGIMGSWGENERITKAINNGELETFLQRNEHGQEIILLRQPIKPTI